MSNGTETNKYRLGQLEKNYDKLEEKVDRIMTNHLPHIEQSVVELKTRVTIFGTIIMTAISGLIGLIFTRLQ